MKKYIKAMTAGLLMGGIMAANLMADVLYRYGTVFYNGQRYMSHVSYVNGETSKFLSLDIIYPNNQRDILVITDNPPLDSIDAISLFLHKENKFKYSDRADMNEKERRYADDFYKSLLDRIMKSDRFEIEIPSLPLKHSEENGRIEAY